jgi:hypothetical protein
LCLMSFNLQCWGLADAHRLCASPCCCQHGSVIMAAGSCHAINTIAAAAAAAVQPARRC